MTDKLIEYLEKAGATILEPTNEWEVARFTTVRGTHVIYRNSKGRFSYSDPVAGNAHDMFKKGGTWSATPRPKKKRNGYLQHAIRKRDGDGCFYCPHPFTEERPATIEHILALALGGSHHIGNLALAHAECNLMAGSMPVMEKIRLREFNRAGASRDE
jgi:hypothetical protein